MNLSAALQGIQTLYIETAPIIYYVEAHPVYIDRMSFIITYLEQVKHLQAMSSTITLAEVLVLPIKENKSALVKEYQDILVNSAEFTLLPVSVSIALAAARLRAIYNLRTPDVIHIASAIEAGCDAFLTNDLGLKRVTELTVLV